MVTITKIQKEEFEKNKNLIERFYVPQLDEEKEDELEEFIMDNVQHVYNRKVSYSSYLEIDDMSISTNFMDAEIEDEDTVDDTAFSHFDLLCCGQTALTEQDVFSHIREDHKLTTETKIYQLKPFDVIRYLSDQLDLFIETPTIILRRYNRKIMFLELILDSAFSEGLVERNEGVYNFYQFYKKYSTTFEIYVS